MADADIASLDLIWGAAAIAAAINLPVRRCYWHLESGAIPARKIGKVWVASRKALRQHFEDATGEVVE